MCCVEYKCCKAILFHSLFPFLKTTLFSSQGRGANSKRIPLIDRFFFLFFPLSFLFTYFSEIMAALLDAPPMTNSSSLGFLYQLSYCADESSVLVKNKGMCYRTNHRNTAGRKNVIISERSSHSPSALSRLFDFFFSPLRKSTHDIACVPRVVDGLSRNFVRDDKR